MMSMRGGGGGRLPCRFKKGMWYDDRHTNVEQEVPGANYLTRPGAYVLWKMKD